MRAWIVIGGAAVAVAAVGLVAAVVAPQLAGGRPSVSAASATGGMADGATLTPVPADAGHGASVFGVCSACHTVGRGGADVDGPNLYGVVGSRLAGRRPRYGYTQALRDAGGAWTPDRLNAWLTDPAAFAPGTAMHFAGLADARDRADVIAYLAAQGPSPK